MATTHGFKAEVQQLLDMMIRSVYAERDVFLRELISNAADAMDKARFEALTNDGLLASANEELSVRVSVDEDTKTITIEDDGIGMTEEEVVENLGTIAKSGTKEFLKKISESDDSSAASSMIGQFGVGFYASFMVADVVTVDTLSAMPGAKPVRWISEGAGSYTVEAGDRAERGTKITLQLREDAAEYAEEHKIKSIIKRHSNYLPWPVMVGEEKANEARALWAEQPSSVTKEERNDFYKSIAMDWTDPAHCVHTSVDSPIQYHAMLFVPGMRPFDLFTPGVDRGPRLYAKRVMIMEHAPDLLPDWLRFVKGVVDSEDIPLNISREVAQRSPALRKISKALTSRLLKDLGRVKAEEESGDNPYDDIWRNFGVLLKEGYYSSQEWREKLLPLLRFNAISHDDGDGLISLADYKAAMPEDQETIWYLTAASRDQVLASPHLEMVKQKGFDVLLLTDPVDEWLVQVLTEFDDVEVKSLARGEFSLDKEDATSDEKANIDELGPWIKSVLDDQVAEVRESSRLTDSACVLVDDDEGVGANMERILRSANQVVPTSKRILELNSKHPLVSGLAQLLAAGREEEATPIARLLLDDALLMDGTLKEPAAVGKRLEAMLQKVCEAALNQTADAKKSPSLKGERASSEVDYSSMTVAALKAAADARGLSGYSKLKKAELVELLS